MKSTKTRLAILTTKSGHYSNSFIEAHKKLYADHLFYFYGGQIPLKISDRNYNFIDKLVAGLCKAYGYLKNSPRLSSERLLKYLLWKLRVNIVLAEYGTVGADCLNVVQELDLKLIVHFHGYDASRNSTINQYRFKYKMMFAYADCIIVVSKLMKLKLIELGADEDKLVLNPYGPDPSFFEIRPLFKKKNILTVGRFVDKKAPYYVILAFHTLLKEHADARLKMVGDGELLNVCKNLTLYLDIQDKVEFLGPKSISEIQDLMSNSHIFVQHSITAEDGDQEGMPNSILEACAAGLPVIATRHAGITELIIEGETGYLVDEHDVQGMSRHMIKLLNDPILSASMGKLARKRIDKEFTQKRHLNQLNSLIAQVQHEK